MTIPLSKESNAFFVDITVKGTTKEKMKALIDSGASISYVANGKCIDVGLTPKGSRSGITCIHGKSHNQVKMPLYEGEIIVGGNSNHKMKITGLSDDLIVASQKIEAVLGTDILKKFSAKLDWKNCNGELNYDNRHKITRFLFKFFKKLMIKIPN